mgnify:CR=1 FL=1
MHQEHQAGVAQLSGHRQTFGGSQSSLLEAFLEIDLRKNAIAAPTIGQHLRLHEGIKLVPGMHKALWR